MAWSYPIEISSDAPAVCVYELDWTEVQDSRTADLLRLQTYLHRQHSEADAKLKDLLFIELDVRFAAP